MTAAEGLVVQLNQALKFFKTGIDVFGEADSGFSPQPELYSVAAHVDHTADTVDWFIEGAFGDGWDMAFDDHIAMSKNVTSLETALARIDASFARAVEVVGGASDADLFAPIVDQKIMPGAPRAAAVSAIADHTAHHRGALSVYARLLGKAPTMPYS